MHILIVGAGAVGAVLGDCLVKSNNGSSSDNRVTFLVKDQHVAPLRKTGIRLTHLPLFPPPILRLSSPATRPFTNFSLLSLTDLKTKSATDLALHDIDFIISTLPSDAVNGPWLPELCKFFTNNDSSSSSSSSSSKAPAFIVLSPGVKDIELVWKVYPRDRVFKGTIAFISWTAPLPRAIKTSSPASSSIEYVLPPTSMVFQGPASDMKPLCRALSNGG